MFKINLRNGSASSFVSENFKSILLGGIALVMLNGSPLMAMKIKEEVKEDEKKEKKEKPSIDMEKLLNEGISGQYKNTEEKKIIIQKVKDVAEAALKGNENAINALKMVASKFTNESKGERVEIIKNTLKEIEKIKNEKKETVEINESEEIKIENIKEDEEKKEEKKKLRKSLVEHTVFDPENVKSVVDIFIASKGGYATHYDNDITKGTAWENKMKSVVKSKISVKELFEKDIDDILSNGRIKGLIAGKNKAEDYAKTLYINGMIDELLKTVKSDIFISKTYKSAGYISKKYVSLISLLEISVENKVFVEPKKIKQITDLKQDFLNNTSNSIKHSIYEGTDYISISKIWGDELDTAAKDLQSIQKPDFSSEISGKEEKELHTREEKYQKHHGQKKKVIRVLSLDGGGVRGIIPATLIAKLEAHFQKPITEIFDLFAGTSTGGILSLCLNYQIHDKPQFTGADMMAFYKGLAKDIFPESSQYSNVYNMVMSTRYSPKNLEKTLKKNLKDSKLSETIRDVLITSFNISTGKLDTFTTRYAQREGGSHDLPLWEVARMTSAAPTYFTGKTKEDTGEIFVDGGVGANNPTALAYAEALKRFPEAEDIVVISLGTGNEKYKPEVSTEGISVVANNVIKAGMRSQAQQADYFMQQILAEKGKLKGYHRIEMTLKDASMDNSSKEHLCALQNAADAYSEKDEKGQWKATLNALEQSMTRDKTLDENRFPKETFETVKKTYTKEVNSCK